MTNHGPATAVNVVVSDPLPAGVEFISASPVSCNSTVTCALGNLAPGGSVTVTIVVHVIAPPCATIINRAYTWSSTYDPGVWANVTPDVLTQVGGATCSDEIADLSVTKSDSPDPVTSGDLLTYTITVHNGGPDPATNVVMTDGLPSGVVLVSATPSQGSCSGAVTCNLGTLSSGASATVTIVVLVTAPAGTTIENTACAGSDTFDPDLSNNCDTETTLAQDGIGRLADLSLIKTDSPDPVGFDQNLTYTISVHNCHTSRNLCLKVACKV